jgi:branched-chain amino acid transport system ATP-binding protein
MLRSGYDRDGPVLSPGACKDLQECRDPPRSLPNPGDRLPGKNFFPMLKIAALQKRFGGVQALYDCSFEVAEGTITGLIGPNGAGKTTLFNVISGLYKPDGGQIYFKGQRIDGLPAHRISRFGLLRTFQIPRVLEGMSVFENLMLYPHNQRGENLFLSLVGSSRVTRQEKDLRERAREILHFVNLYSLRNEPARSLSGGQKKLLELARALMSDPSMIMLDEPGAGVNPTLMQNLMDRIRELNAKGQTFLLIEHDMDMIVKLCHPVVVMADGRKLTEGAFQEISRDERVLSAYLGERSWTF